MPASTPPTTFAELVAFLVEHPHVLTDAGVMRFDRQGNGGLWFRVPDGAKTYLPIECGMVAAETGLEFSATGFTVTKFGKSFTYVYVLEGAT